MGCSISNQNKQGPNPSKQVLEDIPKCSMVHNDKEIPLSPLLDKKLN